MPSILDFLQGMMGMGGGQDPNEAIATGGITPGGFDAGTGQMGMDPKQMQRLLMLQYVMQSPAMQGQNVGLGQALAGALMPMLMARAQAPMMTHMMNQQQQTRQSKAEREAAQAKLLALKTKGEERKQSVYDMIPPEVMAKGVAAKQFGSGETDAQQLARKSHEQLAADIRAAREAHDQRLEALTKEGLGLREQGLDIQRTRETRLAGSPKAPAGKMVTTFDPETGENVQQYVPDTELYQTGKLPTKAGERELAAVRSIKASRGMMDALEGYVKEAPDKRGAAKAKFDKYVYSLGMRPPDNREEMITQTGAVLQQLISASAASGNTRAASLIKTYSEHFPQYGDSDDLIKDKIQTIRKNLDISAEALGFTGAAKKESAGSAAAKPGATTTPTAGKAYRVSIGPGKSFTVDSIQTLQEMKRKGILTGKEQIEVEQ